MAKLSLTDASFIYAENSTCPMSIASLQFMALPADTTPRKFEQSLKRYIGERIDLVPYLTNKLQFARGSIDHPNWVTDPQFDINNHIYSVEVAAPGELKQVEQMVARLHETPLPRSRPLWDIVILTGLANGQVAYYNRVHHACIDGMAAQASTQLLMQTDPNIQPNNEPLPATGGAPQSFTDHLLGLFTSMATQTIDAMTKTSAQTQAVAKLWQRSLDPSKNFGASAAEHPKTSINKTIDRGRAFAAGELSLTGVKDIARHLDSTVNDVFLALCGGALRTYMGRRDDLPTASLVAGCPVSLRKPGDGQANNQVSMMQVSLGTNLEDPIERVLTVRESAQTAKAVLSEASALLPDNVTSPGMGPVVSTLANMTQFMGLADQTSPPFNVLISNVPGPRKPLYSNGAQMLSHYPVSIPCHGVGINITVQSYVDTLYVGVTSATNVAPDIELLRDDIVRAYEELQRELSADVVHLRNTDVPENLPEKPIKPAILGSESKLNDRVA